MKLKNIIIVGILCLFSYITKVNAAGLSVSTSSYTVYVGSTVSITAKATDVAGKFDFKSNNVSVLKGGGSQWLENSSCTFKFTAQKVGTAVVTVSPISAAYTSGSGYYSEKKSITINVINKPAPKPVTPKSSINYLKSLEIVGKNLNPKFDKETAEYSIELESDTTSIEIKATPQDSKASINGTGKKSVSEGINNFNIVVTAENGSKRTYKLKVTVKEKEPIIVKIGNENYTVIRKKEQLIPASTFYSETTVNINNEEIPAYFGEITRFTLVGLKNNAGTINLYIYDKENNSYKLYQELKFLSVNFYPIEIDKPIPKDFFEDKIVIDEIEIPCYKMNENDDFVLLYGINIENNNEGFYLYDKEENTIQRYNDKMLDKITEENKALRSIIIGLLGIVFIISLVAAIQGQLNENKRKREFKNKEEKNHKEDKRRKKEAKMLEKELKKKERNPKKRKSIFDDTTKIDINDINIKK